MYPTYLEGLAVGGRARHLQSEHADLEGEMVALDVLEQHAAQKAHLGERRARERTDVRLRRLLLLLCCCNERRTTLWSSVFRRHSSLVWYFLVKTPPSNIVYHIDEFAFLNQMRSQMCSRLAG